MKKMLLFLALGAWTLLFTSCTESISDAEQVKEIVASLRSEPQVWSVRVLDEGKATRFEHVNGLRMLRSHISHLGIKRHGSALNLEPGGMTLLPDKELVGDALEEVLLASETLANEALASAEAEKNRAEAAKKEASVIKLE